VAQLTDEGHDVTWIPCVTELGDLHAGLTETSLMLHLRPWEVRVGQAQAGNTAPLGELLPTMTTDGIVAVSANGVLGDPTGASAQHGSQLFEKIVEAARSRLLGVAAR